MIHMAKEFYGVVETSTTVKEKYTTKNKRGKEVVKTRNVTVPKSMLVKTGESTRVRAMQVLESVAKKNNGTVSVTGVF